MKIAVAGGTGVVGRYVVEEINTTGHEAVVLSRSRGVDLRRDEGVAQALEGVEVIIDAANSGTMSRAKSTAFFTEVTTRLQTIGAAQNVARLVTLSIVGIDRGTASGYYQSKLAQEDVAKAGPLPVTIVRATQFHEFPGQVLSQLRLGPVAAVPRMQIQPVAARAVGRCLTRAAVDPPPEQVIEVAGPRPEDLVDLARQFLAQRGKRVRVLPLVVPGAAGKAMRSGQLLPTPSTKLVGPRFVDWLVSDDARYPEFRDWSRYTSASSASIWASSSADPWTLGPLNQFLAEITHHPPAKRNTTPTATIE